MKRVLLAAMVLVLATAADAQTPATAQKYLCIADHATGFEFNLRAKGWRPSHFKADERYIVRKTGNSGSWSVFKFGFKSPSCTGTDLKSGQNNYFNCLLGEFVFHTGDLRYLYFYRGSYLGSKGKENSPDTPFIEIGECSPI